MDNKIEDTLQEYYNPKEPSQLYLKLERIEKEGGKIDLKTTVDWINFSGPLDTLIALEIAKATVVNTMIQQQQAVMQRNPNLQKPPWAKSV